jgi:DNA polymerase elongation subunit (family B)
MALRHMDPVFNQNLVVLLLENKFKFLELTKQLTQVTGCLWDNSLRNSKTTRNEMLIMHNFKSEDYILPDFYKYQPGNKKEKKIKSDSYKGGQVINPKKGLYTDYVLMLDFLSLYPSIIREFEICFTSVKRAKVGIKFYTNREEYEKNNGYFYDDIDVAGERHYLKLKAKDTEFCCLDSNDMYLKSEDHESGEETIEIQGDPEVDEFEPIVPKILKDLVKRRKEAKAQIC